MKWGTMIGGPTRSNQRKECLAGERGGNLHTNSEERKADFRKNRASGVRKTEDAIAYM